MRLNEGPVTAPEFARLMAGFVPFEASPTIAVATSGGGDSMALMALAADWAAERGGRAVGLIVDHGLRSESGDEAADVVARLARVGLAADVLAWTGPKPATGIQAAARAARHELLRAWCRRRRVLHLLLAHQRDDQAETVAMRGHRGPGRGGLAGMAAVVEERDLRVIRPLLAVSGQRLRATLRARGWAWVEDPSNVDPRFERVRVRAALARGGEGPGFIELARVEGATRVDQERRAVALLARSARFHPAGFARFSLGAWRDGDPDARLAGLRRLLASVGGGESPPGLAAVARLDRELDGRFGPSTLAGCLLLPREGSVLVCREPARVAGTVALGAGEVNWDGRFRVIAPAGEGLIVRALGADGWAAIRARVGPAHLPEAIRLALPSVWSLEGPVAVPHVNLTAAGIAVRWERPRGLTRPFAPDIPIGSAGVAGPAGRAKMLATAAP